MKSLRLKLLVFFTTFILISITLVGLTAYISSKASLSRTVNEVLTVTANKAAEDIYNKNEQEFTFLRTIASMPFIRDNKVQYNYKAQQLLAYLKENPQKYQSIALLDVNGMAYFANGYQFDFSNGLFYNESKAGRNFISNPQYDPQTKTVSMFYAVPLYDLDNNFAGAVMSVIMGDWVTQISDEITIGKESHPVIISMRTDETISGIAARVAAGQEELPKIDFNKTGDYYTMMRKVCDGESGTETYIDPETGKKMVAAFRTVGSNCSWAVVAAAPYNDYFNSLRYLLQNIIIVMIIVLAIVGISNLIMVGKMVKPLITLKDNIYEISTGNADLRKRINIQSSDEIGRVVGSFNTFSEKLQGIIFGIKESKEELRTAGLDLEASTTDTSSCITQILANIDSMHRQISNQSNSVTQTAGAVNEIASNIESLEKMIENQSLGVHEASAAVEQMIGNIDSVNKSVDKMASSFNQLTNSAQEGSQLQFNVNEKIEQIKNQSETLQEANLAITSIAEQTNLLAMNAAIEAAHAGEAGKGFSVVADEIRKLSETSSSQSKTIGEQLTNIQESIASVVEASNKSSQAFQSVLSEINATDEMVRVIKAAMKEQTNGSRQINESLHAMNDSTIEVRTASKEMAEGNKQILEEVRFLQDATGAMLSSMDEMSTGARKINETGVALTEISDKMRNSINEIGSRIDEFQV